MPRSDRSAEEPRIRLYTSPCLAHGCDACCWETEMLVSDADIARLEAAGHRREDFLVRDAQGFLQLRNVPAEGGRSHCVFLKEGRCSVYADRPQGCRLYPLVLAPDAKRVVRDADCPWRAEFSMDPAAGRKLRQLYATILRERRR